MLSPSIFGHFHHPCLLLTCSTISTLPCSTPPLGASHRPRIDNDASYVCRWPPAVVRRSTRPNNLISKSDARRKQHLALHFRGRDHPQYPWVGYSSFASNPCSLNFNSHAAWFTTCRSCRKSTLSLPAACNGLETSPFTDMRGPQNVTDLIEKASASCHQPRLCTLP